MFSSPQWLRSKAALDVFSYENRTPFSLPDRCIRITHARCVSLWVHHHHHQSDERMFEGRPTAKQQLVWPAGGRPRHRSPSAESTIFILYIYVHTKRCVRVTGGPARWRPAPRCQLVCYFTRKAPSNYRRTNWVMMVHLFPHAPSVIYKNNFKPYNLHSAAVTFTSKTTTGSTKHFIFSLFFLSHYF